MRPGEICARHYQQAQPVVLQWRQGVIHDLRTATGATTTDTWIAPALLDPQVNGFAGVDFQRDELSGEKLLAATRGLRASGCTRFLFTLVTDEWPKLVGRLERVNRLRAAHEELRHAIAGWHVEGPFLSTEPGFHGAHNPALMLDPTPAHIRELRAVTETDPVLLTIAPDATATARTVTVATPGGTSNALSFTVQPSAPTLSSVLPAAGAQAAALNVTLNGTNFVAGSTVAFRALA